MHQCVDLARTPAESGGSRPRSRQLRIRRLGVRVSLGAHCVETVNRKKCRISGTFSVSGARVRNACAPRGVKVRHTYVCANVYHRSSRCGLDWREQKCRLGNSYWPRRKRSSRSMPVRAEGYDAFRAIGSVTRGGESSTGNFRRASLSPPTSAVEPQPEPCRSTAPRGNGIKHTRGRCMRGLSASAVHTRCLS